MVFLSLYGESAMKVLGQAFFKRLAVWRDRALVELRRARNSFSVRKRHEG